MFYIKVGVITFLSIICIFQNQAKLIINNNAKNQSNESAHRILVLITVSRNEGLDCQCKCVDSPELCCLHTLNIDVDQNKDSWFH